MKSLATLACVFTTACLMPPAQNGGGNYSGGGGGYSSGAPASGDPAAEPASYGSAPASAPASAAAQAGPVSVTIRSACSKTVKVFYGDKPKFGSGTYSSISSNSVQSHTFQPGDMFWIVDESENGLGSTSNRLRNARARNLLELHVIQRTLTWDSVCQGPATCRVDAAASRPYRRGHGRWSRHLGRAHRESCRASWSHDAGAQRCA